MNAITRNLRTAEASATRPGSRLRPRDHLFRAATCHVLARARGFGEGAEALARMFGSDDAVTPLVLKAAVNPATMATSTWAGALAAQSVADAVVGLAPASAAAELIARGLTVSLEGYGSITIPVRLVTAADAGGFVGEGQPIQVKQLTISGGPTLTPSKLAVIVGFTREVATFGVQDMNAVVRQVLGEASALALDAAVLSSTAASAGVRPAGILNGVTPITPTAGGGENALSKDIANLVQALATAGAGVDVIFVAAPGQAASLKIWAGPQFDYPVLASAALAAGTIVALEAGSFASAFSAVPNFESSTEALLHFEDTTPLPIGTPGGPPTVAAPTRSLWQTDCIALRMILDCSWGIRASGHVQVINSVTW